MAGRLRRSVKWGIVVVGEFIRRGRSSSESEEDDDDDDSWEFGGLVGVDVDVVGGDDGEAIGNVEDEVVRSSEEEDMLSLEVCWGAGMVVGGGSEFIVSVDLIGLVVYC
jgi:hypothetical protein